MREALGQPGRNDELRAGGITAASAPEWLALEPVLCVGGSWIVPRGADLATVEALAREAAALAE